MMHRVVERGTGRRARLPGWEVAGKTGTTQAARDAWFIGFTARWVIGVWMGNDDNAPLTGVSGGGLPAEIWAAVARRLHAGRAPEPLAMAPGRPAPAAPGRADPGRAGAAAGPGGEATLVQRIFEEVAEGLGVRRQAQEAPGAGVIEPGRDR